MTAHRFSFYVPGLEAGQPTVEIGGDEHRHLHAVVRLGAGETIQVTNGRGLIVLAEIERPGRDATTARVTTIARNAPPERRLALGLSLLQRAQMDAAVAQCVEVGITHLVPVIAEKCHVRTWSRAARSRLERVAVAAMKQCGRGWLAVIDDAVPVGALAARVPDYAAVLVGDGDAPALEAPPGGGDVLLVVGPEAGLTPAEVRGLVDAGARAVSVSRHRLRAATAAVVLAAAVAPGLGDTG